ncbi:transporter substrate-binding domain-containing protein [Streptomyces xiaopingdaonensis]|uniref:transporter substrate-binding domain-containing protein n=1 Tax=Streptomyces xiaopingdaonensis TaxID=1565415 RepID=UPI0002E5EB10|nr:transporter substrate-binding domain-containing protein [Streptomyces xiaopingdaonensis]
MPRRRTRYGTGLGALLLSSALLAGCTGSSGTDEKPERPKAPKELFEGKRVGVGVKKGQPGLSEKPKGGYRFHGFEENLLAFLRKELKLRTWSFDIPSNMREDLLQNEVVKMVVASYSINSDRASDVIFTAPYLETPQGVLARDDGTFEKFDGFKGMRLCTSKGSVNDPEEVEPGDEEADLTVKIDAKLVSTEKDYKTCVQKMQDTKMYDGVVSDMLILRGFEHQLKAEPHDRRVKVAESPIPSSTQLYGIGLPKNYRSECRRINGALDELLFGEGQWESFFERAFPDVAKHDSSPELTYRPNQDDFDKRRKTSCRIDE